jgi:hypothetical protein
VVDRVSHSRFHQMTGFGVPPSVFSFSGNMDEFRIWDASLTQASLPLFRVTCLPPVQAQIVARMNTRLTGSEVHSRLTFTHTLTNSPAAEPRGVLGL